MEVNSSPQPVAVGEAVTHISDKQIGYKSNISYASKLAGQNAAETKVQIQLHPIVIDHGLPTIEFTVDEINSFTKEEGLHQAVIFKLSYGKPDLQDLRQILPKQLAVKGRCIIVQLEYRHILVRFDLFEDFAQVVSRSNGYLRIKGQEFFYRTFPWTMGFNPRKETSKAVVWNSLPELPANLFAQKSILSIASSVGKPIAVDKATKDRSRPSTARVKVLVNLLDKHPSTIKIKIVDSKSGNISTFDQKIVIDNAPAYCTHCCHQGHNVKSCRRIQESEIVDSVPFDSRNKVDKLKGDARDFLNEKRDSQKRIEQKFSVVSVAQNKRVWKQKAQPIIATKAGQMSNANEETSPQCEKGNAGPGILSQQPITLATSNPTFPESLHSPKVAEEANSHVLRKNDSIFDRGHKNFLNGDYTTVRSKVINENESLKKPMTSVSFKPIRKRDFDLSIANSSYAKGSISSIKIDNEQQIGYEDLFRHFITSKATVPSDAVIPSNMLASNANVSPVGDICSKSTVEDSEMSQKLLQVMEDGMSTEFEISAKSDRLADNNRETKKLSLNGAEGSGDPSSDQSEAVIECQILDCEDHQCKDISFQPTGQQHPNSNDPINVSNQLNEISVAHLDMNPVSLKDEKVQCSCNGSQCVCQQNVSIPAENRIDNIQPSEQQQHLINATVNDTQINVDGVHDNEHLGTSELDKQEIIDDQQVAAYTDLVKSIINKTVHKTAQISEQTRTSISNSTLLLEKMEFLNGNKIGGVIKKVNSFTPMSIFNAYSGEDIIDNEDISSFEETNKQVIISSMKESVIKSKLWDQRPFSDEVNWDEGSSGGSSSEEENQLEYFSSGEESDNTINPFVQSRAKGIEFANPAASASGLNHNAPIFSPNNPTSAYHPMGPQTGVTQKEQEQNIIIPSADNSGTGYGSNPLGLIIPSEQISFQNEMEGRHIYEEGEEEDILTQCRINAARRGDLSPMYSNPNKKNHRREISWDDRLVEHAAIRKLPMRMAKQKQVTQPSVTKPRKSKNKAS